MRLASKNDGNSGWMGGEIGVERAFGKGSTLGSCQRVLKQPQQIVTSHNIKGEKDTS
ncbi:MAG: hypothetical protein ABJB34_11880 [Acidobacteriota bacterium]